MNVPFRALAALVLAMGFAALGRAADSAELFPPGTLAYVELYDPASTAPQITAAFEGSVLEDSIAFINGRRDKAKSPSDLAAKEQLAILGLLASPEMAAEIKKLGGIAAGVVSLNEQGEPNVALAVRTGESAAAGIAARALLTLTSVRKIGTVNDVPVYQFRQPALTYDPNTGQPVLQNEKPPAEGLHETTIAYLPGLFVVGSNKATIGELITRFQGKAKGSLAATPSFKEAAAAYRQPGIFFYANAAEFCSQFDRIRKKPEGAGKAEPESLGWFKLMIGAKSLKHVAGCAKFRDGGLAVSLGGIFDPAHKSPLFDFLGGPGTKVELLRHAPVPATIAVAVSFSETNRVGAVVGFLDALAKSNGVLGRLPSETVKELEAKFKTPIAAGLIGKTQAITLVLPVKQDLPKGAVALPILVMHTENAEVAAAWEDLLPKLIGDLAGTPAPQIATEVINGMRVISLPAGKLPWKSAVHYTRKDGVFAIGLDRKLVVAAARGETTNGVVLPAGEPPVLVGSLGLGGVVRLLTETIRIEGPIVPRGPPVPAKPAPGFRGGFGEDSAGQAEPGEQPESQKKEEAKAWEAILKALDGLPTTSVSARRIGSELRIELWQPKVRNGGLAPLINAGVGWFDKVLGRHANPNGNPHPYGLR